MLLTKYWPDTHNVKIEFFLNEHEHTFLLFMNKEKIKLYRLTALSGTLTVAMELLILTSEMKENIRLTFRNLSRDISHNG